jgi:hypothetical protein
MAMPPYDPLHQTPKIFRLLRQPFLLLLLLLLILWGLHSLYRMAVPAPIPVATPANPTGEWVGEMTLKGESWYPTTFGDTPGPHHLAAVRMKLDETDGVLERYGGPGLMRIVGEGIDRPFRAYDWEYRPDGSITFGMNQDPQLFFDNFECEVSGSTLTCRNSEALKAHFTLYPGTDADFDAIYRRLQQQQP